MSANREPMTNLEWVRAVEDQLREWLETGGDEGFRNFLSYPYKLEKGKEIMRPDDFEGSTGSVASPLGASAGQAFLALVDALGTFEGQLDSGQYVPSTTAEAARWVIMKARGKAQNTYRDDGGRTAFGDKKIAPVGSADNVKARASGEPDVDLPESLTEGRSRRQRNNQLFADISLDTINENRARSGFETRTAADEHKRFSERGGLVRMGYTEEPEQLEIGPMEVAIRWACTAPAEVPPGAKEPYGSSVLGFTETQVQVLRHMSLVLRDLLNADPRYLPVVEALEDQGLDPTGGRPVDDPKPKLNTRLQRKEEIEAAVPKAVRGAAQISGAVMGRDYAKTLRTWHEVRVKVTEVLYLLGALSPIGAFNSVSTLDSAARELDRQFEGELTAATSGGAVLKVLKAAATVAVKSPWGGARLTSSNWRGFISGTDKLSCAIREDLAGLLDANQVATYPVRSLHWCEDVVAARMDRVDPECVSTDDCEGHPLEESGLALVRDGVAR